MRSIKKSLLKLATLLYLASATSVYAGAYVMPVDIDTSNKNPKATMEIIAWTEEEGIPNPCYGWPQCYVGPDVQYDSYDPGMWGACRDTNSCLTNAQIYRTTADVMRAYKKKFSLPFTASFPIIPTTARCVGLFYANQTSPRNGSAKQFPGSTCGKLPPPQQSCKLDLPSEIAYGELTAKEVNNATRTITGQFRCAIGSNKIMLYARSTNNEDKVYLDSGKQIYSTLQIDKEDAANGVNVTADGRNAPTYFTLTSVLHTSTLPKAGKYEGTAIVLLRYL
ncbi:pilus assembly protein [Xenorhabdus sp. PR6a]|uniref:MrpH family fimbial adhesin n=1 Tax=Xenorhabdus sp. PR6a TaxID=3025877 RepID=UPI00235979D4|nr:pilus assembly protein [Xenorhabdus sp. PR6a]MDC9581111.1 pilus assembly protein [Xenorhabdus sp. PR6a]